MKVKIYHNNGEEMIFDKPDQYSLGAVNQMLLNIIEALGEIPTDKIALLPDQAKRTVASILKLQALRYSVDDEEGS